MSQSWKEDFFEKLVEASHAAGDARLATAKLHPRKKIASYEHPQLQWLECVFDSNRTSGNQDSQVLIVECTARRGTEVDGAALRREVTAAGISGDLRIESDLVFAQYRWGFGKDAAFPVHDPRRVHEAIQWTHSVLRVLFDHLERRRQLLKPAHGNTAEAAVTDYALALEKYLEDLIVEQWESLPWAAELEYLGRQVAADEGFIDILARDRTTGDFVVIELKRDQTDDEVVGQLSRYMGWAKERRATPVGVKVRGIIVAHEATPKLRAAASAHDNVNLNLYKLAIALQSVSLPGR
jgi:Holliday junction resolvase-like predicted endonuclease